MFCMVSGMGDGRGLRLRSLLVLFRFHGQIAECMEENGRNAPLMHNFSLELSGWPIQSTVNDLG